MNQESVLKNTFGNGTFQIVLLILLSTTCFLNSMELQSIIFMYHKPKLAHCIDSFANNSEISWINESTYEYLRVGKLKNLTEQDKLRNLSVQCYAVSNENHCELFKCTNWNFTDDFMSRTVVMDFGLICGSEYLLPSLNVSYLLAIAFSYLFAVVIDKIGRRPVFLFLVIIKTAVCIFTPFVTSVWWLLFARIMRGLPQIMNYIGFAHITELLPIEKRPFFCNMYWLSWSLGYMTCAGLAYLQRDWRKFKLLSLFPLIVNPLFFILLPESPRWLLVKSRNEEAFIVWKRIIKYNRPKLPSNYLENLERASTQHLRNQYDAKKEDILDAVRNSLFCRRWIIFCFCQSSISFSYIGLTTSSTFVSDNIYLNSFLQGLIEFPTAIIGWRLSGGIGRRSSISSLLCFSSLFVGASGLVTRLPIVKAIISSIGKLCLTTAYCILDVYIAELMPTSVRSAGLFSIAFVSSFFSAFTPFTNAYLQNQLALYIYAVLIIFGSGLIFAFLPETANCPMPDTIAQSQGFTRGNEKKWAQQFNNEKQMALKKENEDRV